MVTAASVYPVPLLVHVGCARTPVGAVLTVNVAADVEFGSVTVIAGATFTTLLSPDCV